MASILKSTLIEFLSCQLNLMSYSVNGPPPLPRLGVDLHGRVVRRAVVRYGEGRGLASGGDGREEVDCAAHDLARVVAQHGSEHHRVGQRRGLAP